MPVSVNLQTVYPRKLAAVRREVAPGAVGSAWGPALGKVWEFIRSQPGLRTDGHNIFLYHHPTQPRDSRRRSHCLPWIQSCWVYSTPSARTYPSIACGKGCSRQLWVNASDSKGGVSCREGMSQLLNGLLGS